MATAAPHMKLTPDLDTGPAQLGRGGVCEGCAAEPLALGCRPLPPAAVAVSTVMHTAPAAGEGWAGSIASVRQAES